MQYPAYEYPPLVGPYAYHPSPAPRQYGYPPPPPPGPYGYGYPAPSEPYAYPPPQHVNGYPPPYHWHGGYYPPPYHGHGGYLPITPPGYGRRQGEGADAYGYGAYDSFRGHGGYGSGFSSDYGHANTTFRTSEHGNSRDVDSKTLDRRTGMDSNKTEDPN